MATYWMTRYIDPFTRTEGLMASTGPDRGQLDAVMEEIRQEAEYNNLTIVSVTPITSTKGQQVYTSGLAVFFQDDYGPRRG